MTEDMSSIHGRASELLPWYINGTLEASERDAVERHLRDCLACRALLRQEQRLAQAIVAQDDLPISPALGIAGLLSRIDRPRTSRVARAAIPLGLAATVLVAAMFIFTDQGQRGSTPVPGDFATLTSGAEVAPNRIDLIFTRDVSMTDIETVVGSVAGSLVAGPSELGRYTAEVPAADEAELIAIIDQLADDPRVLFAGRNFTGTGDTAPASP